MRKFFPGLIAILLFYNSHAQFLNPEVDSIPMRDGKKLAADIYLPDEGAGDQYPVILVQTPYNRLLFRFTGLPLVGYNLENSDYAFVILDWRCFFGSQSACITNPKRGQDGYDAVEWIAQQPWSNGEVGTWGSSALGKVQFQTAREQPPHLVCAVPRVAAPQFNYLEYFPGGAIRTEYVEQLDQLGFGLSAFLYNNVFYDTIWGYTEYNTYYPGEIEIPTLMIGGWYDHNIDVSLEFFNGLQEESPVNEHKMLIGPWTHSGLTQAGQGQLSYPDAASWCDSLTELFFEYYLLKENNGWENTPNLQYYQTGAQSWKTAESWPPGDTVYHVYYLDEGGMLKNEPPEQAGASVSIPYNPRNPSPTTGGPTLRVDLDQGPCDQVPVVESRDDIAIFSTEVLSEDFTLNGKIKAILFISSNRTDTDIALRLTDVFPDGRSMLIRDGIRRARFRDGYRKEDTALMIPGNIYQMEIELDELAYTFKTGHKIRLDVTSSNYPRFDCNLNNGGEMYTAGDTLIAENTIYFNQAFPSRLLLPVPDSTTGIRNMESTESVYLKVYPNPVREQTEIQISNLRGERIRVQLTDLHGHTIRQMFQGETHTGTLILKANFSDYTSGMYFIILNSESVKTVYKVIIK